MMAYGVPNLHKMLDLTKSMTTRASLVLIAMTSTYLET